VLHCALGAMPATDAADGVPGEQAARQQSANALPQRDAGRLPLPLPPPPKTERCSRRPPAPHRGRRLVFPGSLSIGIGGGRAARAPPALETPNRLKRRSREEGGGGSSSGSGSSGSSSSSGTDSDSSTDSPFGSSPEVRSAATRFVEAYKVATAASSSKVGATPGVAPSTARTLTQTFGEVAGTARSAPESTSATKGGVFINRRAFTNTWREGNVRDNFAWCEEDELGRGAFGRVFRGRSKYLQRKVVAVKQLSKSAIDDLDSLYSEISVLSDLDHPNVLRFLEAYSDKKYVYIVTEVCLGGSLQDWAHVVCGNSDFAKRVAREISGALTHCHSRGVCHRDLKLDNILLLRNDVDSPVRIADFGLAKRCSQRILTQRLKWSAARAHLFSSSSNFSSAGPSSKGTRRSKSGLRRTLYPRFTSVKGTPGYMAPEVMRVLDKAVNERDGSAGDGKDAEVYYDFRCDVWSLGVIIHALMVGDLPYSIYDVSFHVAEGEPLPPLKESLFEEETEALDFIKLCLCPDFRKRSAAEDLLDHEWIARNVEETLPTPTSASDLGKRLRGFAQLSQFKRATLLAAVRHLGAYEHEQLRALFQKVDVDHVGTITAERLRQVLSKAPPSPTKGSGWVDEVARALDSERKGEIDYTEFMAAVMDHSIEDRRDLAMAAFKAFDLDNDGVVTLQELQYVLEGHCASDVLRRVDAHHTGELSFDDFVQLLRQG